MAKTEQKYQYLAALHEFAKLMNDVAAQADLLARAYTQNAYAPAAANEITDAEAGQNNFTLQEIADMLKLLNSLQDFWTGKTVTADDYRKYNLRSLMYFLDQ